MCNMEEYLLHICKVIAVGTRSDISSFELGRCDGFDGCSRFFAYCFTTSTIIERYDV